jgi:hypothetical protein
MQLEPRLNMNSHPGVDSEVIDLVQFSKKFWGIKVRVGANTYMFEFDGSLEELEQELLSLRREQESDIVTCPFCGAKYIWAFAMPYLSQCSCGVNIVYETARDTGTGYSPELERLWVEGCSALGLLPPPNRRRLHIDNYFENVKHVGKGTTDWRIWFVKKPWKLKIDSGKAI